MAQFFDYPLNYGGGRSQYRAVADNDYNTFTSKASMFLHIDTAGDGSGTAREFTDIFIKTTGVENYGIALTDPVPSTLTFPNHTLPKNVTNDSRDTVSITDLDGFQNDLHSLWEGTLLPKPPKPPKPKAKSITLTFTAVSGETPRIYEIMVLNRLLTLNSNGGFSRIEYDSIDLGTVEPDLRKRLSYVPPIGGERDKWLVNLTLQSPRKGTRETLSDQLVSFIRRYKRFVFAPEYNRYPERVFPALWPNPETQVRYISRWKGGGRRVLFSVRES